MFKDMFHLTYFNKNILSFLLAFAVFNACSGPKESIKEFNDVQAMNSQILNYRDWIQGNNRELVSLDHALKPILKSSLRRDFPLHEKLTSSLIQMREAHDYILVKAKMQRKTVALLQKEKNIGPGTEIEATETTYGDDFSAKDSHIRVALAKYNRNRSDLTKALKKKNKKLIFISDQMIGWKPTILKLQERRESLRPRIDKLTESVAIEITFDKVGESVELISQKTEKVDEIGESLNRIDQFFNAIDSIARKEVGGNAYVMGSGGKKMKYERRYQKFVTEYRVHLTSLDILLPD